MLERLFIGGVAPLVMMILSFREQMPPLRSLLHPNDTISINKVLNYAVKLNGRDNQKAIELYKIIQERSEKLHYDYGTGSALMNLGLINMWKGNYYESIYEAKRAITYLTKLNDKARIGYCFYIMGTSFHFMGFKDTAMSYQLEG